MISHHYSALCDERRSHAPTLSQDAITATSAFASSLSIVGSGCVFTAFSGHFILRFSSSCMPQVYHICHHLFQKGVHLQ